MEEKIISQFTSVSAGDADKLMDMYSTLNFCSNTTSVLLYTLYVINLTVFKTIRRNGCL